MPRLTTNPFGSSLSWATWMPVISAAMPPDALHSATAMATTAVIETPAALALTIDVSWNTRKSWTSAGSDEPTSSTWRVTSSGSATSP